MKKLTLSLILLLSLLASSSRAQELPRLEALALIPPYDQGIQVPTAANFEGGIALNDSQDFVVAGQVLPINLPHAIDHLPAGVYNSVGYLLSTLAIAVSIRRVCLRHHAPFPYSLIYFLKMVRYYRR